jgi:hypothetical protein
MPRQSCTGSCVYRILLPNRSNSFNLRQFPMRIRLMLRILSYKKTLALFLILAIVTARIGSVSYERFVQPIQSYISQAPFYAEGETNGKVPFAKPKRSCIDLVSILAWGDLIHRHPPVISYLLSFQPFRPLPEVYLEKFYPPDPTSA